MTNRIPKNDWPKFFDDLSKRRFEWQTRIEIINEAIGNQVLADGLPLIGITAENKHGKSELEIIIGQDSGHHQTHSIKDPSTISYLSEDERPSGIVEIEEADGTKTLVYIIKPMPLVLTYDGKREIAATK